MMRRIFAVTGAQAVLLAALLAASPPASAAVAGGTVAAAGSVPKPSRAHGWVVRIAVLSGTNQEILQVGDVAAEGGATPWATAVPAAAGGQSPWRASASPATRDAVATPMTWNDQTGSANVEGAFAEAHVAGDSARARAGISSQTGTGFPVANKLLTWDQQEQLMNQWMSTNDQIFVPLNQEMQALASTLALANLSPPHFEPMAGLGWIDVAKVSQASGNAETSSSQAFSSARASVSIGAVRLLGGFIEAANVRTEAISESQGGQDTRTASATFGKLKIAGIDVVASGDGFRVAGNDLFSRALVQPALDQIMAALKQAGVRLWVGETRAQDDLREAAALQLEIASPQGTALISVAHAEASAASVGGWSFAPPPALTPEPVFTPAPVEQAPLPVEQPSSVAEPSPLPSSTPKQESASPDAGGPRVRGYPASAVRSLRTAYLLLFLIGGIVAAVVVPMMARPAVVRPTRKGGLR